jgi:ABC-type microcin C transport system duplicated ATPase subunit YejF
MEKGKLVESASVSELFANPQQPYTRKLLQSRPQRNADDVSAQAPVVLQAEKVRCTYHIKQGWFAKRAFHAVDGIDLQLRAARPSASSVNPAPANPRWAWPCCGCRRPAWRAASV